MLCYHSTITKIGRPRPKAYCIYFNFWLWYLYIFDKVCSVNPCPACSCWNLFHGFVKSISFFGVGDTPTELLAAAAGSPPQLAENDDVPAAARTACSPPRLSKGDVEPAAAETLCSPPRLGKGDVEPAAFCEPEVIFKLRDVELLDGLESEHSTFTDMPSFVVSTRDCWQPSSFCWCDVLCNLLRQNLVQLLMPPYAFCPA